MAVKAAITPVRTDDQRMAALKKANKIRIDRAELKKNIKEGITDVCDVLGQPPEHVMTMKVLDLLKAVPKYGRVKVTKLLQRTGVSQAKTVGGMSERQRRELIALFRQDLA